MGDFGALIKAILGFLDLVWYSQILARTLGLQRLVKFRMDLVFRVKEHVSVRQVF